MLRFYAEKYTRLLIYLDSVATIASFSGKRVPTANWFKVKGSQTLGDGLALCKELGLDLSCKHIETAISRLDQGFINNNDYYAQTLHEIVSRIQDELATVVFMHLTMAEAELWNQNANQFGEAVADKFPRLAFDIEEAAKCLAVGRYTASVFHCMRVMELAVQYLGKRLGIKLVTEKNWHNILDEVDKAIKSLPLSSSKQKKTRNRFAEASAHLRAVKDAWRNEVMHPHEKYTKDEAERIFANVKDFMMYLAVEL